MSGFRWSRWLRLACMAAALALPGTLAAQVTTGSITGTITADNGQPVDGAQIQVQSPTTGFTRAITTRTDGRYLVSGLEVGSYVVTVRRIGFAPKSRNVVVSLSQASRADFTLATQAAQLSAVQAVASSATDVISPTRTGVLTTVTDSALRRLPSLNRNFSDFVALTPQVSTTLSNGGLSGGGVNNRYNQVEIDGSNETDLFGLGSTGQPGGQANGKSIGIESVKEYQVLLAPFDVRAGNFAGLLINAVTRGGTNEFHGSVYGFGRNQNFTRTQPYLSDYSQLQYGAWLSGPIVKNKALFFLNVEPQRYNQPASGVYLGSPLLKATEADVTAAANAISQYGVATGSAGLVKLENPLTNVFARLDFPDLPHNSSLTLHYNYGSATSDAIVRGTSGNFPSLALTANEYSYASTKHAPSLELRTNFASGAYNEFRAAYTRIRDPRQPMGGGKVYPQVTVDIPGAAVIGGTERYSQGNEVDQDITELTDNVTLPFGAHTVVIGTQDEFFKARNLYAQSSAGVWSFDSVDSLTAGLPWQYIVGVPAPGTGDGSVRFKTQTWAGYVQDEWAVTPNMNVTGGVRVDIPTFSNTPPTNPDVLATYNRDTGAIPSGHLQWSPRLGFNWNMTGDERNQLRGGVGMFTGHPAYVWMSNAFQNSGLTGVNLLTCQGKNTPPQFTSAAAATAPTACGNGLTASSGSEIDLLQSSLRMPQTLRGSLGFDRDLGHQLIGTLEALYTKAVDAPFYTNIALAAPIGTDAHGRVLYGTSPNNPNLVGSRSTVLDVGNESKDHSYNLTAQVQRRFFKNWEGSLSYTYSRAWDVQSLTSSTAYSNYRYGRVWAGNQFDETATRSAFEQRHRIVGYGSYTLPTATTLSLIYTGVSGSPYAFVYGSADLNGNGLTEDDPIYIPTDATDPNQIRFDGTAAQQATQANEFNDYINSHDCLKSQRGKIMERNSCTAPFMNNFNVSIRQALKFMGSQNLSAQLDIFNFGNLLNKNWGQQPTTYSEVDLLKLAVPKGYATDLRPGSATPPIFHFDPTVPTLSYNNLQSNYSLQLSLRYSF